MPERKPNKKIAGVYLDENLHKLIKITAAIMDTSASEIVSSAIKQYLGLQAAQFDNEPMRAVFRKLIQTRQAVMGDQSYAMPRPAGFIDSYWFPDSVDVLAVDPTSDVITQGQPSLKERLNMGCNIRLLLGEERAGVIVPPSDVAIEELKRLNLDGGHAGKLELRLLQALPNHSLVGVRTAGGLEGMAIDIPLYGLPSNSWPRLNLGDIPQRASIREMAEQSWESATPLI